MHKVTVLSVQTDGFTQTGVTPSSNTQLGKQSLPDSGFKVKVFTWTYFAVSTAPSLREAALAPTARDDSLKPSTLEVSTASDMAAGAHSVTEREE